MAKKYGTTKEEENVQQAIIAREISKTIMDYGVSQYQIQKIIYLLSLELENVELMQTITETLSSTLDSLDINKEEQKLIIT